MITTDKTRRAIEAIKTESLAYFNGSLPDYLIECLESLETAPSASDAEYIKKELAFIITAVKPSIRIGEMEECIDDWCSVAEIKIGSESAIKLEELPTGLDTIDRGLIDFDSKLKYWHLSLSAGLIFLAVTSFLIWS